jgi:hypothetical protein
MEKLFQQVIFSDRKAISKVIINKIRKSEYLSKNQFHLYLWKQEKMLMKLRTGCTHGFSSPSIKTIFFLCLVLLDHTSIGQGIYEIKYKFYETADGKKVLGNQEYTSLVFFFDAVSPNNIMRTRYYDAKDGWTVVEQKIKINTSTSEGKTHYTLDGVTPKFVTTVTKGITYNPDHIVLAKSSGDKEYIPEYVFDDGNNKGEITSFVVLDKATVTNEFLTPYKWSWKTNTTTTKQTTADLANSTMHVILVTNSEDKTLGDGFLVNHKNIAKLFKDAANTCNMKINIVEVKGSDFNKSNVLSAIANLYPSANDVVVFYYSGHGFRFTSQTIQWPQLDLRPTGTEQIKTNTMNLHTDVYKALSAKNPRLLMVIGECCNIDLGVGTPSVPSPLTMPLGTPIMNESAVKNLLATRGKMLVATSKPYESTWYYHDTGGFFGTNFMSTFLSNVGFTSRTTPSWSSIFKTAMNYTVKQTEGGEGGTKPQHPIYLFE